MRNLFSDAMSAIGLLGGAETLLSQVDLVPVTSGFNSPIAVTGAGGGSGRLFIVEQAGVIRIWDGNAVLDQPFLDISELVDDEGGEQGLLGLTFHPSYSANGFFFVNYITDPGAGRDRTRIARYQVSSADSDVADAASAMTILEIKQDFATHNGGDIHFGPDGYSYIATGDGGSGGDPNDRAQDRSRLLGKALRIDVDGSGPGQCSFEADYGIPADNPYVGQVGCDEIWAYGFRNPWRWSFDRETGDILIGDVGQDGREEIDFQPASSTGGENYEWGCREGNTDHPGNCRGPGPRTPPILDYAHDHDHGDGHEPPSGCAAVTGGYRYRDSYDELRGTYIYADFCSGIVWFANDDQGLWQTRVWRDTDLLISSFGEDDDGEIYLANYSGTIYQLKVAPEIFSDGFESGDTALWKSLSP